MSWREHEACKAYHFSCLGNEDRPYEDTDIQDSRATMRRDVRASRNISTSGGDERTMNGMLKFWRGRI